jgi:transcriptional regulator with XRE-family HTH domain
MEARAILAANIKRLRAVRGLSQEALADGAGIDRTYVSALEHMRYAASIDTIERLAAALNCSIAELLTAED